MTVQFEVVNPRTLEMQRNESNRLDLIEQVQTLILEQIFIYFFFCVNGSFNYTHIKVARAMNLTSGEEIDNLNSVLFPSLLCSGTWLAAKVKLSEMKRIGLLSKKELKQSSTLGIS